MSPWVLLLRGVNVGGKARLPNASLQHVLSALGMRNVATYIQSGNAVFSGPLDPATFAGFVSQEIAALHGFSPHAMILSRQEFLDIRAAFPFAAAESAPNTGHVWFLEAPPDPGKVEQLKDLAADSEDVVVTGRAVYLHAPDGIGRSRLASRIEPLLGTATARNLKTVEQLCQMAGRLNN